MLMLYVDVDVGVEVDVDVVVKRERTFRTKRKNAQIWGSALRRVSAHASHPAGPGSNHGSGEISDVAKLIDSTSIMQKA